MGKITIRNNQNKKQLYKGDSLLVPDLFNETIEYFDFIVAFNEEKFFIINPLGDIIVFEKLAPSQKGTFFQINDADKRISFKRNKDEKMGVYSYKGDLIVPFDYDLIYLKYRRIEVKKNYFDSDWKVYDVKE